ncbi:hypothetical protein AAVH_43660, partial [Aphelenchoides avenae]
SAPDNVQQRQRVPLHELQGGYEGDTPQTELCGISEHGRLRRRSGIIRVDCCAIQRNEGSLSSIRQLHSEGSNGRHGLRGVVYLRGKQIILLISNSVLLSGLFPKLLPERHRREMWLRRSTVSVNDGQLLGEVLRAVQQAGVPLLPAVPPCEGRLQRDRKLHLYDRMR